MSLVSVALGLPSASWDLPLAENTGTPASEEPVGGLGLLDLSQLHLSLLVHAWTRQSMISGSFAAGHHDVSALDGSMTLEERAALELQIAADCR